MPDFEVVRSETIAAPAAKVHGLIDDFHEWRKWSPWEDVDPDLEREYSGAEKGVGARYAWKGNRKAGQGNMEITEDTPQRVTVRLTFEKPWKATNRVDFELEPADEGQTNVIWRMTGTNSGFSGLVVRLMGGIDKMVGKDFEKGLTRMKAAAEA